AVATVTASDVDAGDTLTFTIAGGDDAALFDLDAATGLLTFKTAPDYEAPADAGADNSYDVTLKVSDGTDPVTQAITVMVTDANDAPVFTLASTALSAAENQTSIATVTASDADGDTLTFTIADGDDAALFDLDAATGVLTFKVAPDFEAPADVGADNSYNVTLQASDDTDPVTQAITVTVTDANDAPAFTLASTALSAAENQMSVTTVTASDVDAADTLTFTIAGGDDAALFDLDALTGVLTFKAAPDYEVPADVGADNSCNLTLQVSDGTVPVTQAITVMVADANDAPAFTLASTALSAAENQTAVAILTASDVDTADTLTFTIAGGADPALFDLDSATGVLTFKAAPDYEAPADAGADNSYDVTLKVSDGTVPVIQAITVTVTDANDAPAFTLFSTDLSAAENQTSVATVTASDVDAGDTLTFTIVFFPWSGGADAALFDLDASTGVLTFKAAPDYEAPADADGDKVHELTLQVGDGTDTVTQAITVRVTDANDAPVNKVPADQSIVENSLLTFLDSTDNGFSVFDQEEEDTNGKLTVSLQVNTGGVLTLSTIDELKFASGDGTEDAGLKFSGEPDRVNAALDGLKFQPEADFVGVTTLTIESTDDLGIAGSSELTDKDIVTIIVSSANNTPVVTGPAG
ncbi:MAG: hypothetical protein VB855_02695, partial [Pirellulaceae bacterium]